MKRFFLTLIVACVIVSGCAKVVPWWEDHNEQALEDHNEPITQYDTWRITQENGYFLVDPSTYRFKYWQYFQLIWQLDITEVLFSGQILATIDEWFVSFEDVLIRYPDDAKARYYTDRTLQGYTLGPEAGRWSGQTLSLSPEYFTTVDRYYVWSRRVLGIEKNIASDESVCEDKNDQTGPGADVADDFLQTTEDAQGTTIYKTYRSYDDSEIASRDVLCFVVWEHVYIVSLYNYPRAVVDVMFDSMRILSSEQ